MGRIFESTIAASIASVQHAVFGRPGASHGHGCNLDDMRALSREFALAANLGGGGAMLAIQTLGHQSGPCTGSHRPNLRH